MLGACCVRGSLAPASARRASPPFLSSFMFVCLLEVCRTRMWAVSLSLWERQRLLGFQSGLPRPCPRWPERNAAGHFSFSFFFISPAAAARRLNIQRFCSCGERTRRSSEKLHEPPCLSLVVRVYIFDFHFFPHGPATYGHLFLLWHSVCVCVFWKWEACFCVLLPISARWRKWSRNV